MPVGPIQILATIIHSRVIVRVYYVKCSTVSLSMGKTALHHVRQTSNRSPSYTTTLSKTQSLFTALIQVCQNCSINANKKCSQQHFEGQL